MKINFKPYLVLFFVLIASCKNEAKLWSQQSNKIAAIQFSTQNFFDKEAALTYVSNLHITEDENLNILFDLEEPLLKSLQNLEPEWSQEELLEKGNFQFEIYVDDNLAYTQNLQSGAGTVASKTKQLSYRIPLMHPERIDYWGWYLWLRFMKMAGGQDKLFAGEHQLKIKIRPYLKSSHLKVGSILAEGEIRVSVSEIPVHQNEIVVQPIKPNSGWTASKSNYDSTKIEDLNKKIAQSRFEAITSIVVIKEGELLLEEYFNDANRDSLHNTRSVGKSFASTMMGIAINEGYIENENLSLTDYYDLKSFDNYSESKTKVTLKSLLTMSSGFVGDDDDYDSPGNEENMYPTEDWVKFTLDLPMDSKKEIGKDYDYFTAGVVVLGDVIHKSVPKGLVAYSDEKLFAPLGIEKYKWQYTPTNVGNTAGGLQLRSLDYAKFGQLYKNKGTWKNQQLIPEEWVEKSLSKLVAQPYNESSFYGYLFWNRIYTVNGKDYEVSFCTGYGGNKIFIFKDIPFVIVITAQAFGLPYAHAQVDTMMVEYILPAILEMD
ncbi:serine hydrolase domain-containing protein [Maribacter antarcticus]|uniref:serine hydrolase domain-containing protein n=1 Tax=Maribacter antarcticus TaxID=505250 RepID=UPI0004793C9E|nr:serine hydrolase [Maribacter antarcticus]